MSVQSVVTRGFGNGTFSGSIAYVSTRGYDIGDAEIPSRGRIIRGGNRSSVIRTQARCSIIRTQARSTIIRGN